VVAHIVKTRGLRGELVADLLTDFPERFEKLKSLIGISSSDDKRSLQIEEQWFHGNRLVLKFAGFDSIVPCGLSAVEMTSIARELGDRAPADLGARARAAVRSAFVERLG